MGLKDEGLRPDELRIQGLDPQPGPQEPAESLGLHRSPFPPHHPQHKARYASSLHSVSEDEDSHESLDQLSDAHWEEAGHEKLTELEAEGVNAEGLRKEESGVSAVSGLSEGSHLSGTSATPTHLILTPGSSGLSDGYFVHGPKHQVPGPVVLSAKTRAEALNGQPPQDLHEPLNEELRSPGIGAEGHGAQGAKGSQTGGIKSSLVYAPSDDSEAEEGSRPPSVMGSGIGSRPGSATASGLGIGSRPTSGGSVGGSRPSSADSDSGRRTRSPEAATPRSPEGHQITPISRSSVRVTASLRRAAKSLMSSFTSVKSSSEEIEDSGNSTSNHSKSEDRPVSGDGGGWGLFSRTRSIQSSRGQHDEGFTTKKVPTVPMSTQFEGILPLVKVTPTESLLHDLCSATGWSYAEVWTRPCKEKSSHESDVTSHSKDSQEKKRLGSKLLYSKGSKTPKKEASPTSPRSRGLYQSAKQRVRRFSAAGSLWSGTHDVSSLGGRSSLLDDPQAAVSPKESGVNDSDDLSERRDQPRRMVSFKRDDEAPVFKRIGVSEPLPPRRGDEAELGSWGSGNSQQPLAPDELRSITVGASRKPPDLDMSTINSAGVESTGVDSKKGAMLQSLGSERHSPTYSSFRTSSSSMTDSKKHGGWNPFGGSRRKSQAQILEPEEPAIEYESKLYYSGHNFVANENFPGFEELRTRFEETFQSSLEDKHYERGLGFPGLAWARGDLDWTDLTSISDDDERASDDRRVLAAKNYFDMCVGIPVRDKYEVVAVIMLYRQKGAGARRLAPGENCLQFANNENFVTILKHVGSMAETILNMQDQIQKWRFTLDEHCQEGSALIRQVRASMVLQHQNSHLSQEEEAVLASMMIAYLQKFRGQNAQPPGGHAWVDSLWVTLGVFILMLILSAADRGFTGIEYRDTSMFALLASFGAVSAMILSAPTSFYAQPRNILGGHVIASVATLTLDYFVNPEFFEIIPEWIGAAIAPAITTGLMTKFGLLHPPAVAVTVLYITSDEQVKGLGWMFFATPVLFDCFVAVFFGAALNNLSKYRVWPLYW